MWAFEVEPHDHVNNFEVRERSITNLRVKQPSMSHDRKCVSLIVGFDDGYCDAWELQFAIEEWAQIIATISAQDSGH
jgi:hypothetical protein